MMRASMSRHARVLTKPHLSAKVDVNQKEGTAPHNPCVSDGTAWGSSSSKLVYGPM
jgi:hypothetical protein